MLLKGETEHPIELSIKYIAKRYFLFFLVNVKNIFTEFLFCEIYLRIFIM